MQDEALRYERFMKQAKGIEAGKGTYLPHYLPGSFNYWNRAYVDALFYYLRHGPPDFFLTVTNSYQSYPPDALPTGAVGLHCPNESAAVFHLIVQAVRHACQKLFPHMARLPVAIEEQLRRNLHFHGLLSIGWLELDLDRASIQELKVEMYKTYSVVAFDDLCEILGEERARVRSEK